jgi:SAM-dependent methyltransferase
MFSRTVRTEGGVARTPHYRTDAKRAAIHQWSNDPCGPEVEAIAGTREYLDRLIAARHEYAPWMRELLNYDGAAEKAVLDVGCGQGIDLVQYAMAGANATGVDLTPRHVQLARAHVESYGLLATVVEGDAENLPFASGSFDQISSNGVLHHTPDMDRALREIRRALRPGGEARIIVYNRASAWFWLTLVFAYGIGRGLLIKERGSIEGIASRIVERSTVGARPLVRFYTPRRLRRMLRAAGFSEVRTVVRGFNPDDQFATKALRHPGARQWLDRRVGYYVIGYGRT